MCMHEINIDEIIVEGAVSPALRDPPCLHLQPFSLHRKIIKSDHQAAASFPPLKAFVFFFITLEPRVE